MPSSFFTVQQDGPTLTEERVTEHTLEDAPILPGRLHELNARGRTCKSSFNPMFSQGFTWISEKQVNTRMQSSFIGASTSLLPEELLLYSFDMPRQRLTPARVKFMEKCSVVFEELQETHSQYAVPGYLNQFSKLYESHFEALCTALDAELKHEPANAAEIEDEVANISSAMNLIHLTQAIYFQPNPSAIMAEDLMHWVNRLDSKPDPEEGDEIVRRQPACNHPAFWGFLHKAASRALFKVAIRCLEASGLVEFAGVDRLLLQNILHLLGNAPLGKQSQLARRANELWDLKNSWKQWRSDIEKIQIAAIRNETSRNGLGVLLKILCGDRDTMADVSESWQEYVASMAFFAKPFALNSYKDVQELYDDAMAYGFNIDNTLPSEIASSALFTADLPRALVNFYKTDIALAVHMSDLLAKSGVLEQFDDGETMTLRDQFTLDYGDLAVTNLELAYPAFTYWKSVVPQGIWRLEEAIVRIPLESQGQVDKFIDLCSDLHLEEQRAEVCQAWARQLEEHNEVGLALSYFEKGHGFADIERICWKTFESLLLSGGKDSAVDPNFRGILRNPPQSPMSGTLIAPVALLFSFFELKEKGNAAGAVQYLSKLFRLSSMPREYIALLMAELLPIFEDKPIASIGRKELFEVLASVEDYIANEDTSQKGSELLSKAQHQPISDETDSPFKNWRDMIPYEYSSRDIVSLFRLKATHIVAHLYTTN